MGTCKEVFETLVNSDTPSEDQPDLFKVTAEYHDLQEVFSKDMAQILLALLAPAFILLLGASPPWGRLFSILGATRCKGGVHLVVIVPSI